MSKISKQSLIRNIRSGVIHIDFFRNIEKQPIASGSGFLANNHLITCNHLYEAGFNATMVKLSWQKDLSPMSVKSKVLSSEEFKRCFKIGSSENEYDYAVFNVPDLKNKTLHNFTIHMKNKINICDEALILGYPLGNNTLCCHKANISSLYVQNGVKKLLLDASVNQSNSGGPLIDMSGNVIGIITRKATGLSDIFDKICKDFDYNIEKLSKLEGIAGLVNGDIEIDVAVVLKDSQVQLKSFSRELLRSANVGIGYAYDIEYLYSELKYL